MAGDQFMDEVRWPINRLETAVIQILRTALLHPADRQAKEDIADVCSALEQRAYIFFRQAGDRWAAAEYAPPDAIRRDLTEIQEALIRRLTLAQYAQYIYKEIAEGNRT